MYDIKPLSYGLKADRSKGYSFRGGLTWQVFLLISTLSVFESGV